VCPALRCGKGGVFVIAVSTIGPGFQSSAAIMIVVIAVVVIMVIVVIAIPIAVPVVLPIPMVIVVKTATIPIPIPYKILPSVMVRGDPTRAHVRRPCPVSLVPFVVPSYRIPIALDPDEIRVRGRRKNADHTRRRRRPDIDPN
jgi:hypothetical protein